MRSGWLFLLSFLLALAVVPAFASVTYAPVTIDTVISNGQYVARPVVLDTAGFATTTGRVSTLGGRATFGVAVRASAQSASLILRTGGRFLGPLGLVAAGALTLYDRFKDQGLQECAAGSNTWCVKSYAAVPMDGTCTTKTNGTFGCYWFSSGTIIPDCPGGAMAPSAATYWFGVTPPDWAKSTCIVHSPAATLTPATDADFEKVEIPFAYPVIGSNWSKVVPNQNLPVDAWKTTSTPYAVWTGNPYVGSDGQYRRDALIINPGNSTFPAQVRVESRTFGPSPTPDPLLTPTPVPGSTPEDPNQPQLDLCAINPDIIACAQQEDYYARMAATGVSSAAMTQQQFEESDKKFGDAVDAVGAGAPPDNSISGAESANDSLDNIVANIDSVDLPGLANIEPPSYSQCKTISFEYQNSTFVFPTASQCEKIEQIKLTFGYFLAGLVLVSLVWQLLTRPQG